MRLHTKILLLVIPLIVAPLLILGWLSYSQLLDSGRERTLKQMGILLQQLALHYQAKKETAQANIGLFASHNLVKQYALTTDEEERYTLLHAPLIRTFKGFQTAFPDYYDIRFVLPDGFIDAHWSAGDTAMTRSGSDMEIHFEDMIQAGTEIYSRVYFEEAGKQPYLLISKRLSLRDQSIDPYGNNPLLRGYLVLTISLDSLQRQINENRIGQRGFLAIVDEQRNVLMYPDNLPAADLLPVTDKGGMRILSETYADELHKGDRHGAIYLPDAEQGMFIEERKLSDGLHLAAFLPEREVLHEGYDLRINLLLITLFAMVFTSLMLIGGLRSIILFPLQRLGKAAHEIGRGKLDYSVTATSGDEIGELSKSFGVMAQNLRRSNEQMEFLAKHDDLTGLPNRRMFKEYLGHALAYARRHDQKIALLFLDLDDFKRVNDVAGHESGDKLLTLVADRLAQCIRYEDYMAHAKQQQAQEMIARLGGDEFIILLTDIQRPLDVAIVAKRMIAVMQKPFHLNDHNYFVGASIGITLYPDDSGTVEGLVKNADIAMYHAKNCGKNSYQYFSSRMNEGIQFRVEMESKIREALQRKEFSLQYQPQIDITSGRISGLEALLRWEHPEDGMIPPDIFISVAEESGLIVPITEWVLNEACRQNHEWQMAGLPGVSMAVNISSIHMSSGDICKVIQQAITDNQLDPRYLDVELTESHILSAMDDAIAILNEIHDLGVQISLDDFGTGYSSLNYLRRLPIHTLKIDRSFVSEISSEDNSTTAIISAVIAMAHALNLKVVAEGVETKEQLEFLKVHGCDIVQGYIYSKPRSADEIAGMLASEYMKLTM